jgi:hypothetical protein
MDLAACAEMIYLELPFADRARRIAERGFLVEIWDWTTKDVDELAATGARFSSMTGYVTGPDGLHRRGRTGGLGVRRSRPRPGPVRGRVRRLVPAGSAAPTGQPVRAAARPRRTASATGVPESRSRSPVGTSGGCAMNRGTVPWCGWAACTRNGCTR